MVAPYNEPTSHPDKCRACGVPLTEKTTSRVSWQAAGPERMTVQVVKHSSVEKKDLAGVPTVICGLCSLGILNGMLTAEINELQQNLNHGITDCKGASE